MPTKPILLVDFDGVIHSYTSPWAGVDIIPDPPVPGALEWLWKATEWFDVQVYSSRSKEIEGRYAMSKWMRAESEKLWGIDHPMARHVGHQSDPYPITFCHEKPAAFLTIDDRAICFNGGWSVLDPQRLLQFKPWNKLPQAPESAGPTLAERWADDVADLLSGDRDTAIRVRDQLLEKYPVTFREEDCPRCGYLGKSQRAVSPDMDKAITDELSHPPKDIMK